MPTVSPTSQFLAPLMALGPLEGSLCPLVLLATLEGCLCSLWFAFPPVNSSSEREPGILPAHSPVALRHQESDSTHGVAWEAWEFLLHS